MNFGKISPEVLKLFYEYLGFDLIVLHFGANVLTERTDYTFYEKSLLNSIFHFKKSMNNIPVMIIGSSDRVIKSEGREMTNPAVYGLMKAQRMAAVKTKTAYFDLFEKMGGSGSMIQWAKSNPQKASSDFVHFSGRGSKDIARYIYDFLIQGYSYQTGDQLNNKK
jgi:lysophospholipase L1-like esterase